MSDLTPRYRSFQKAYGGDPDTAVLRDLHKRVMRLEIDIAQLTELLGQHVERVVNIVMASPVHVNAAREEGVSGGGLPPPSSPRG